MSNVFLKPANGPDGKPVHIRDPLSLKPLDARGEWKSLSPYWSRRIRDNEVIDATADAPKAVKPGKPKQ